MQPLPLDSQRRILVFVHCELRQRRSLLSLPVRTNEQWGFERGAHVITCIWIQRGVRRGKQNPVSATCRLWHERVGNKRCSWETPFQLDMFYPCWAAPAGSCWPDTVWERSSILGFTALWFHKFPWLRYRPWVHDCFLKFFQCCLAMQHVYIFHRRHVVQANV